MCLIRPLGVGGWGFLLLPPPRGLWRPKILDLSECEGYYCPHAILYYSLPQETFSLGERVVEDILDVHVGMVEGELDLIHCWSTRDLELIHHWSLNCCTI